MQIVSFGVAALYSGMWCLRWARGSGLEGAWRQLGLLSGMVCVGSVAGAVAWGSNMQSNALLYEASFSGVMPQRFYTLYASSSRFGAVFFILYSFEFLCLIICKLMLLGRLAANATQSSQAEVTGMRGAKWLSGRALLIVYRVMAGAVVVGGVAGLVANIVAGAYTVQAALLVDQAAAACDAAGNDTILSLAFSHASNVVNTETGTAISVQSSSEALTLLLVSIAFVVIVSWSVALFRLAERVAMHALLSVNDRGNLRPSEANAARIVADAMQAAAEQRRRLTVACVIVLITFPVRAAFDLLQAYADFNDPYNPACGNCDPCQSTPFLISNWFTFTPEFQSIVVAVSSPLPLTLSLWLLTKAHARARLIAADVERARAGVGYKTRGRDA
jgi:hypothetical protein